MNCFLETLAGAYIGLRTRMALMPRDDLALAEQDLEMCRANLTARERDVGILILALAREALAHRSAGDVGMATLKMQERRRCQTRQGKLRNSLCLLDKQLDALRSNELDKQIITSLRQSSKALRGAGMEGATKEAENVMTELEEQMREASDLTSVLATPLLPAGADEDMDLDTELAVLLRETMVEAVHPVPRPTVSMFAPEDAAPLIIAPSGPVPVRAW